jgi:DNA-binding NtrC family response regulator
MEKMSFKQHLISAVIKQLNGNKNEAAKVLNMSKSDLNKELYAIEMMKKSKKGD